MRDKLKNSETIMGKIYQFKLEKKTSKKGVPFIGGSIDVATDDEGLNVVTVNYSYVAEYYDTEKTKPNKNYAVLSDIITNGKSWVDVGPENATKIKCTPSLALNVFIVKENNEEKFVESMRNDGGFVITNGFKYKEEEKDRKKFNMDIIIEGVIHVDENEENGTKEHAVVKARAFDYKKMAMPVEFSVYEPDGIAYFESLDASKSNPIFTEVEGTIENLVVTMTKEVESAWGGPKVETVQKKTKAWVITWANPIAYDLGEDGIDMTYAELREAMQAYETYKAEVKANRDAYEAEKNNRDFKATTSATQDLAKKGNFVY